MANEIIAEPRTRRVDKLLLFGEVLHDGLMIGVFSVHHDVADSRSGVVPRTPPGKIKRDDIPQFTPDRLKRQRFIVDRELTPDSTKLSDYFLRQIECIFIRDHDESLTLQ